MRISASRFLTLAALVLALACALPAAAQQPPGVLELGMKLEREKAVIEKLHERLRLIESQSLNAGQSSGRTGRMPASLNAAALSNAPSRVESDSLSVDRRLSEHGLTLTVSARNVPAVQVLEAIAQVCALPLEVHPGAGREALMGRLWMDLRDAALSDLLDALAGTQGLTAAIDDKGIIVAPITALSDMPADKLLREMSFQTWQAALLKFPDSPRVPDAYLGVARHYRHGGFHDAAVQAIQPIFDRYPASPACAQALLLVGNCRETQGRYDAARAAYFRYLDSYPGAPDVAAVALKVGETWIREDKWNEAMPLFESVFQEWPNSREAPLARVRLAECLVHQQQYQRAMELMRQTEASVASLPQRDHLKLLLAQCYVQLDRPGAARIALKQVIQNAEDRDLAEQAYYALGDTFMTDSQPLAAVEAYRGAMYRFADGRMRAGAPLRLARAYLLMDLVDAAEREIAQLPDDIMALPETRRLMLQLGELYLRTGNTDKVFAILRDRRWPHDTSTEPDLLALQGEAQLRSGAPDKALASAQSAVRLAADDATRAAGLRLLGRCHQARNDLARAAMAFGGKIE